MRKVTLNARNAFQYGKSISQGNTQVTLSDSLAQLYLHGNLIATKEIRTGKVYFTLAGWPSKVTRERLQAAGITVVQRKEQQWLVLHGVHTLLDTESWYRSDGTKVGSSIVNRIEHNPNTKKQEYPEDGSYRTYLHTSVPVIKEARISMDGIGVDQWLRTGRENPYED